MHYFLAILVFIFLGAVENQVMQKKVSGTCLEALELLLEVNSHVVITAPLFFRQTMLRCVILLCNKQLKTVAVANMTHWLHADRAQVLVS